MNKTPAEYPPQDENLKENFEPISPKTPEQAIEIDHAEREFNKQAEQAKIQELRSKLVEKFEDTRLPEEKQVAPEEIKAPKEKGRRLKKWLAMFGLAGVMASGAAKAETGGKNPADSLGKKDRIEKVESKERIGDQIKSDWNDFLGWMKEKGMQGKPELDQGGLGYKYFDQYVAEHPGTSLSREKLAIINNAYKKLREWNLQQIKAGKAQFAPGVTEENFMKWVVENEKTEHPEYPGSNFTRQFFPEAFEIEYTQGDMDATAIGNASMTESGVLGEIADVKNIDQKVAKKTNKGFTKIGPDFTKKNNTVGLPGTDIANNK